MRDLNDQMMDLISMFRRVNNTEHIINIDKFEHKGFSCVAKTSASGIPCGYVGVPNGHPWYGKSYDDIDIEIHGGLTFSDNCVPDCEKDDLWWVGFDMGHYLDHDKTIDDAKKETKRLAKHAKVAK